MTPRSRRTRGKSDRRRDRQPIGQDDQSGGPRGYAAEKMIKGRKRHILTDTIGLPVAMIVHPAIVPDRDGAPALLESARGLGAVAAPRVRGWRLRGR